MNEQGQAEHSQQGSYWIASLALGRYRRLTDFANAIIDWATCRLLNHQLLFVSPIRSGSKRK
jgi:hypothetical protein